MGVPAETGAAEERLNLLDALIYGGVFDCAVTLDELWRYAHAAISRDELRRRLHDDPVLRRIVVEQDGLFCLDGRTALLDKRPDRIRRARRLQRRARRVARVLRHIPFVHGLILTGSTSADDASEQADIDLLVIVAPGRLGTAFLLLGSTSWLLRRRLFCPNWYVREGRLGTAPGSIYIAREFAQARSLVGSADQLRDSNPWLMEFFPNAFVSPTFDRTLKGSTPLQRLFEAALRGALGDRLEGFGRRVASARLRAHYTRLDQDVPADVAASFDAGVALRFHGYRYEEKTVEGYAAQRAQVMDRLEQAEQELRRRSNRGARI